MKWDDVQLHRWYELTVQHGTVLGGIAYWFQSLPGPHCHEVEYYKYEFSAEAITYHQKIPAIYSEDIRDIIEIFNSYTYIDISYLFYSELVYEIEGSMLESIRVLK